MALTARALPPVGHIVSRRLPGPDVVRAVALIGVVVMNFHGYLVLDDRNREGVGSGWAAELFNPWTGPLSTRFAATFVLVAGVGVTLLTRSAVGDDSRLEGGVGDCVFRPKYGLIRCLTIFGQLSAGPVARARASLR